MTVLINATAPAVGPQPSVKFNDLGSLWKDYDHTVYSSGTFAGGVAASVQISPDPLSVADASSRWYNVGASITAPGYFDFTSKFKKIRANVTALGTGTIEIEVL